MKKKTNKAFQLLLIPLFLFMTTGNCLAINTGQGNNGVIPQVLSMPELSITPTSSPPAGRDYLYFKNDGVLYSLDDAGVESAIAGGGGGGGSYTADESTLHLSTSTFSIKSGGVTNTQVSASAAILLSKLATGTAYGLIANNGSGVPSVLAPLTASRVVCSDSNGTPTACTVTAANLPSKGDNLSVFAATTSSQFAGVLSDETGTGAAVFGTSPTLTTPALGAATASSINGVAITPATSATIAMANSSTLTVAATASVSGTNTGDQTITLTGDVTGSGTGSFAATIGSNKVTNAMLAGSIDLTSKVTGTLPSGNGGTGNAFFGLSGPASSIKTYTFPNANAVVLTDNSAVTVAQGGTGAQTLAAHGMLSGNGTSPVTVATPGPSGQVWTSNGPSADASWQAAAGGTVPLSLQEGRITLSTGVPYPTADVSAATSVFWTPATGGSVALYNGSAWQAYTLTEKSIKLTDAQSCATISGNAVIACTDASQLIAGMKVSGTGIQASSVISSVSANNVTLDKTASGSATNTITFKVPANTVLDVFGYVASGSPKLKFLSWSSSSARATALDCTTGVCYTSGDSTYRNIGTVQVDATDGQISLAGINCSQATGGTLANIPFQNRDNLRRLSVCSKDSTDSWSHANNSIWSAANASTTMRARFILGQASLIESEYYGTANISGAGVAGVIGVGLNSTTAFSGRPGYLSNASFISDGVGVYKGIPALGTNYVQAIDYAAGGSGVTFYGDAAQPTVVQNQIALTGAF